MPNASNLVRGIINVSRQVLPLLGPQGATGAAALTALERLLADARRVAGPADVADLEALQQRVSQRARDVAASLRGTPAGGGA